MKAGDRVKLTPRAARTFMMARRKGPHRCDWYKRCGTVVSISVYVPNVCVQWDDRVSVDYWPTDALEVLPK